MVTIPSTTYTFSSYTFDEVTKETSETKVEFSTTASTASQMAEKFEDFLRANGFSWVGRVDILSNEEVNSEYSYSDDTTGGEQMEFTLSDEDVNLDLTPKAGYSSVNYHYDNFDGVTYGGVKAGDVSFSIFSDPQKVDLTPKSA